MANRQSLRTARWAAELLNRQTVVFESADGLDMAKGMLAGADFGVRGVEDDA